MRIIKFRVWDKYNKKMFQHKDILGLNFYLKTTDGKNDIACPLYQFLLKYQEGENQQYNYVIQQFTGLKDKSGKDIYEGDIIKSSNQTDDDSDYTDEDLYGVVEYSAPIFKIRSLNCFAILWNNIEVVGNTFENPEFT